MKTTEQRDPHNVTLSERVNQMIWQRLQEERDARIAIAQELVKKKDARGFYDMGKRYLYGWGVPSDVNTAINYLDQAANEGHAGACCELVRHFLTTDPADRAKALTLLNQVEPKLVKDQRFDTPEYKQYAHLSQVVNFKEKLSAVEDIQKSQYPGYM